MVALELTSTDGVSDMVLSSNESVCACLIPATSELEMLPLDSLVASNGGTVSMSAFENARLSCRRVLIEDEDEAELSCVIAFGESSVAVGDAAGRVRVWEGDSCRVVLDKIGGEVRAVSVSADGKVVAAAYGDHGKVAVSGSSDGVSSGTAKCACMLWSPGPAHRLAILDTAAKFEVWQFEPGEDLATELKGSLRICRDEASLSQIRGERKRLRFAWARDGRSVAVPGRPNLVMLPAPDDQDDDWESKAESGFCEDVRAVVLACAWGTDLVATASIDGKVVVWSGETKSALASFDLQQVAHCLLTSKGLLLCASNDGRLAAARVPLSADATLNSSDSNDGVFEKDKRKSSTDDTDVVMDKVSAADDDEEDQAVVFRRKKTSRYVEKAAQEGEEDDEDEESPVKRQRRALDSDVDEDEGDSVKSPVDEDDDVDRLDLPATTSPKMREVVEAAVEPQPAFMPCATEDDEAKFLHWSSRGAITSRRLYEDEEHYVVEMEHYGDDNPAARTERMTTTGEVAAATLGAHGAFFGRNDGDASTVSYHAIGSWDSQAAWRAEVPPGETVSCVAAGDDWVAAFTSRALLRLYSIGGVSDAVVSLPGHVVTACGKDRWLAVAFHISSPFGASCETQEIAVAVYDVRARQLLTCTPPRLPIPRRARLKWLGIADDDAAVVAMDDTDSAFALVKDFGWSWTPVLDWNQKSRRNAQDRPWPVSVSGGSILCATLKGGATEPSPFPRPVLEPIAFDTPLASGGHDANVKDAEIKLAAPTALARHRAALAALLRDERALPEPDPVTMRRLPPIGEGNAKEALCDLLENAANDAVTARDKAILRMLLASLKAHKLQFAFDLASRLACDDSLDLALKIADAHGSPALVHRLEALIEDKNRAEYFPEIARKEPIHTTLPRLPQQDIDKNDPPILPSRPQPPDHEEQARPQDPPRQGLSPAKKTALAAVNNPFKLSDAGDKADRHHTPLDALGALVFSPDRRVKKRRSVAILPKNNLSARSV